MVLDAVAAAGFDAVGLDLYTLAGSGAEVDEVAAWLALRRLRCTDVGIVAVGGLRADVLERLARAAVALEAPVCIAALARDVSHEETVRDLREAAAMLAPAGVRLAFEFTAYGYRRSLADAVAICDEVGWEACGLLVDAWHVFRGGEPLSSVAALSEGQIALVHLSDGAAVAETDAVLEGRFRRRLPGTGSFDLTGFAAAFATAGYTGPVSLEVLSEELLRLDPSAAARRLRESALSSLSRPGRASRETQPRLRQHRSS
jgi:sugar phosphate isomerase/epimerase